MDNVYSSAMDAFKIIQESSNENKVLGKVAKAFNGLLVVNLKIASATPYDTIRLYQEANDRVRKQWIANCVENNILDTEDTIQILSIFLLSNPDVDQPEPLTLEDIKRRR